MTPAMKAPEMTLSEMTASKMLLGMMPGMRSGKEMPEVEAELRVAEVEEIEKTLTSCS